MSDFHLGQKFDVIYCVHNSLNHLLAFEDWVSLFQCVSRQLKKDGLFIFDLNSEERLERLSRGELGFYPAGEHYVMTKISKHPEHKERYNWEMRMFIRQDAFSFRLQPTTIEVSTYPVSDVLRALSHNFALLDTFTLSNPTPDDLGRMYFVCRKW
jgi:SAM-dependent methyltransferase